VNEKYKYGIGSYSVTVTHDPLSVKFGSAEIREICPKKMYIFPTYLYSNLYMFKNNYTLNF